MSLLGKLARGFFFVFSGAVLLAFAAVLFLLVAVLTGDIWGRNLPPSNTAKGQIAEIAWEEPISSDWQDKPTDISDKACPLVDEALSAEISVVPDRKWVGLLGTRCFTQERVVVVWIDEVGLCRASVDLPPPSCAL